MGSIPIQTSSAFKLAPPDCRHSMSVFSFSKTDEVWGLNRATTKSIIDWWIEQAGSRPYLLKIRESYERGYNHGDLTVVTDADKAELRDLVMKMLKTGYEREVVNDDERAERVRESIFRLWSLINADLEGTPHHQTFSGSPNT
jgi:hypothetical protein